jgi:hypothetical protein
MVLQLGRWARGYTAVCVGYLKLQAILKKCDLSGIPSYNNMRASPERASVS